MGVMLKVSPPSGTWSVAQSRHIGNRRTRADAQHDAIYATEERATLRVSPLRELIDSASKSQTDLLVVGARGTSGVRHLLLDSVAEGVLDRSPLPVLLAR